jgi:hypothetical protein
MDTLNQFALDMNYPPGVDRSSDPAGCPSTRHDSESSRMEACLACGSPAIDGSGFCSPKCALNEDF